MKARRIDYSRVPELAAAGFPYDAIAKEIGCSYSVLTVYCRKHGIAVVSKVSTRSPSAAMLAKNARNWTEFRNWLYDVMGDANV